MKTWTLFLIVCGAAAIMPLLSGHFTREQDGSAGFPGWSSQWRGVALRRIPLTWREQRFAEGFPGQIAQFTDGSRLLLMRYTAQPTRKLHSAADCFRGAGYRVSPLPLYEDEHRERWGRFEAVRDRTMLIVSERVFENAGDNAWTDVSSWYWSASFGRTGGPWWAVTMVEEAGASPAGAAAGRF
ncbi:MAG: hypothetical protein R2762_12655 [Bryobacteraceae bacterium]